MSRLSPIASVLRLHIVAIATLGALVFGWIFTGRHAPFAAAACGLDWFFVNLLNRVADLREDGVNAIPGTAFVARHQRAIVGAGVFALAASIALTALLAPRLAALRVAYHLLGLAYNWPVLPGRRRLKERYFWKNTASATGFLLTVFGYPLAGAALARDVGVATVLVTAAFFFLFEVSYEVLYDLRDLRGDAALGVPTYAVVHGAGAATRLVYALALFSIAILVGAYVAHVVPWRVVVMVVAPAVQVAYARRAVPRGITAADCVRLTWIGAALLFAYLAWVALALPGA